MISLHAYLSNVLGTFLSLDGLNKSGKGTFAFGECSAEATPAASSDLRNTISLCFVAFLWLYQFFTFERLVSPFSPRSARIELVGRYYVLGRHGLKGFTISGV
jgi:hypothetical protein